MSSNIFTRLAPSSRGTRSFYEQLRSRDDDGYIEERAGLDEENLREQFNDFDAEGIAGTDSRITVDSLAFPAKGKDKANPNVGSTVRNPRDIRARWQHQEDEIDNDVPASLLVEPNETEQSQPQKGQSRASPLRPNTSGGSPSRSRAQWEAVTTQQRLHADEVYGTPSRPQNRSHMRGIVSGSAKEKALWRWVNTSNLDSFMRDVYDYYEGGGLWCILCTNALWLLYEFSLSAVEVTC